MKKLYLVLALVVLAIICVSAYFYFDFTAEDAYITYRYAEDWVEFGSLVYNVGEPINAMTSPLHAVLSSGLFLVTGNTVLGNKILGSVLLLVSGLLVLYRSRGSVHLQVLALILLVPSSVLLWTFGGLETPLLLFLVTVTVILALRPPPFGLGTLCAMFFLAGLAFLTRYDSVLFFVPLCIYAASKSGSVRNVAIATAAAAILPLTWLLVSVYYYGDLLPTSFYVKTPNGTIWSLIYNGGYIASNLLFVGIIPVVILVLVVLVPRHKPMQVFYRHFRSMWWLYAGLLLEIAYGLTMATHHMMFSFRFFVPYLPSAVILVVDLVHHATDIRQVDLSTGRPAYLFAGFLAGLILFQVYQNVYTYNRSVNGISPVGEYRSLGIRDYIAFIGILKQEGLDIQNHWQGNRAESGRPPRVITFAAGMLPYTFRDSYIYEKLVSYRHCHERYEQALYADYIHILAPRQGEVADQLPRPESSYELVSSYEMLFDGSPQHFLVYYNPEPEPHNLTATISGFCTQATQAAH